MEKQKTMTPVYTKINQNGEATLALLKELYPTVFVEEPTEMRPLKIGIHKDLFDALEERQISRTSIRSALALYTNLPAYKPLLELGAKRIDLTGEECGEVEAEHIEREQKRLEKLKPKPAKRPRKPYKSSSARPVRGRHSNTNAGSSQSAPKGRSPVTNRKPNTDGTADANKPARRHPFVRNKPATVRYKKPSTNVAGSRPHADTKTVKPLPKPLIDTSPTLADEIAAQEKARRTKRPVIMIKKRRKIDDNPS